MIQSKKIMPFYSKRRLPVSAGIILLTFCAVLAGCGLGSKPPTYEQMATALFPKQITTPSGSPSNQKKIGDIIDILSNPYEYEQSGGPGWDQDEDSEEISLNISYTDKGTYTKKVSYDWVYINATALFSLIDDIDVIHIRIFPQEESFSVTRQEANELMGGNVRDFAKGEGIYTEFWQKLSLLSLGLEEQPGLEVYVWKNKGVSGTNKTYYTLLTDTAVEKTEKQICNMAIAVDTVIALNREIAKYPKEKELVLYQLNSVGRSDDEMQELLAQIKMPNEDAKKVLGIWRGSEQMAEEYSAEQTALTPFLDGEPVDGYISSMVEKRLTEIVGDSQGLGLADECINRHPQEYQAIKSLGTPALKYMLSKFQRGTQFDLKGEVMQRLCEDMLGNRVMLDPSLKFDSPQEWFDKSGIGDLLKLPEYEYATDDSPEALVSTAYRALKPYDSPTGAMIVTPKVHFTAGDDTMMKVFASLFVGKYEVNGESLEEVGAEVTLVAITYSIHNGVYVMENYEEAEAGEGFAPSVTAMCTMPEDQTPIDGLAETLTQDYTNYNELAQEHQANLKRYITSNHLDNYQLIMSNKIQLKNPQAESTAEAENE